MQMNDFFDDISNVEQYIDMCKDYNPSFIITELKSYLKEGKTMLELGSGPGHDLKALKDLYKMTGSDRSEIFVEKLNSVSPEVPVLLIDAVSLEVKGQYDCIFSNKVLQHLTSEDMMKSINRQLQCLNDDGIIFHTLWYGEGEESFNGLRFVYYNESSLQALLGNQFEISMKRYTEMEEDDSILIIGKKKE